MSAVTPDRLDLSVKFDHPEAFGSDEGATQSVVVSARFSDFEPGWDDEAVLAKLKVKRQKKQLT